MDLHIAGPVLLWCHEGTALVTHSTSTAQLIAGDVYYSPESVMVEENGLVIPLLFPDIQISGSARRVHVGVRWSDVIVHEFSRSLGLSIPAMRPSPALLRIFDDPVALPPVAQTPEAHAVSCAIADNPADQTGLEEFAQRHGISSRTLQRQFVNGTGFTFSEWRTAYRVHAASELLSLGFSGGQYGWFCCHQQSAPRFSTPHRLRTVEIFAGDDRHGSYRRSAPYPWLHGSGAEGDHVYMGVQGHGYIH